MAPAQSNWTERAHVILTAATLAIATLLGGGQGTAGDSLAQVLALMLLACVLLRWRRGELDSPPAWTWIPVVVVVAIPLLQLVPLPSGVWRSLAGRAEIAAQLHAAGVAPATTWSLDPTATERALAWLLPGIALYVSLLRMRSRRQAWIVGVLLALAAANAVLGLAQLSGGAASPLRFYSNTNPSGAVGFFANRNHLACLLAMALPLAFVRLGASIAGDRSLTLLGRVAAALLFVVLLVGLAMTVSRAGILLGMFALAVVVPLLFRMRVDRGASRMAFGALLLSSVLVMQVALFAMMQRFAKDPLGDDRVLIALTTLDAADAYAPVGSGIGTFRQAFPPFEGEHARADMSTIVNHAHDDYLELWLEAGWAIVPAGLLFLGAVVATGAKAMHRAASPRERLERAALAVAVAVPLMHSLVDYPLRTSAVIAAFGVVLGLLAARAVATPPGTTAIGLPATH